MKRRYQLLHSTVLGQLISLILVFASTANSIPKTIPSDFADQEVFQYELTNDWLYLPNSSEAQPADVINSLGSLRSLDTDFNSSDWLVLQLYNESQVREFSVRLMSQYDSIRVAEYLDNYDEIKESRIGMTVFNPDYLVMPRLMSYEFILDRQDTVILMFKGDFSLAQSPPVTLNSASQVRSFSYNYDRISYVFSAIFLMMILYNLSVYSIVRDKSYAYYCLMAFGFFLHAFNYQLEYWFTSIIASHFTVISATIISVGGMGFWKAFVDIKRGFWQLVWLVITVVGTVVIVWVSIVLLFNIQSPETFSITSVISASLALVSLISWTVSSAIYSSRGRKNARLFLWSNLPLAMGGIYFIYVWMSRSFGGLILSGDQVILTNYILFGSLALQMILFSVSIGYSIKKASVAQLESERKQKQQLEDVVNERTEMLRNINLELVNKNNELEKTNGTKNRLLTILSHDLRSPINNVASLVALLREHRFSPNEFSALLPELEKSINDTTNFMSLLISWTQSQNEGLVPNKTVFSVDSLVRKAINHIQSLLNDKNLTVNYNDVDLVIMADRNMMDLVVRNLLSNAIKFSYPEGEVDIECRMADDDKLQLDVRDYGVGIDKERMASFFDVSKKNTTAGTSGEKGFGMGLILCKDFVQLNGGELTFDSKKEKGSTFSILIPTGKLITTEATELSD